MDGYLYPQPEKDWEDEQEFNKQSYMTTRSEKWLRALLANLSLRDTDDVRCSRCEQIGRAHV